MPTDKVKNVLKSFGEGVDVVLQDALSRANRPAGGFDIGDGEAVDIATTGGTGSAQNPLDREPVGAIVVNFPDDQPRLTAVRVSGNNVTLTHEQALGGAGPDGTFTVWVF